MKYNKDKSIAHKRLTEEEKREVNKNTRISQQKLNYLRNNPKSVKKNTMAGLGGAALGAGLAYGTIKGAPKAVALSNKLKVKSLDKKIYNSVHKDMESLEKLKKLKDSKIANGVRKEEIVKIITKGLAPNLMALGATTGGVTGTALRDSSEVKKYFKNTYGETPYTSIRMNEKKKVLDKREKTASDIVEESFNKIAKLTEEEEKEYRELTPKVNKKYVEHVKSIPGTMGKTYAGAGAIAGGTMTVNKARRSGSLDGVVRRYHNTKADNVKGIKEKGILSSKALDKDNITSRITNLTDEQKKGKTYLAKNRYLARSVGAKRHQVENAGMFYTPSIEESLLKSFKDNKTLKVNIPLEEYKKLKKVDNPELKGAKSIKDLIQKQKAGEFPGGKLTAIESYLGLGKGTDTVVGDISSKFIKGGKGYQKRTLKDLGKHIKNNPKMFAKGVGVAGLGTAGALGGAYLIADTTKKQHKRNKDYKNDADVKRIKELNKKMYSLK